MARRTLLDLFADIATIDAPFVAHDDGYRTRCLSYREIAADAQAFADRLRHHGIVAGDHVLLWCENRPEWLAVLWGCLLEGVVVVPVDYRGSAELTLRIAGIVDAKGIVFGDVVAPLESERPVWRIGDGGRTPLPDSPEGLHDETVHPQTVAEIIFN
ncbi:hypothetical protein BH18ACI5_BH18ACI5_02810 [soil metagenome]